MLAKDPVERPRDGAEVAAALLALQAELGRTPSAGAPPVRRRRPVRARWAAAAGGLLAIAVAVVAVTLALRHRDATSTPAVDAGEARVTIAVADFENQTGEPELGGLSGMLITSLEQSRRLSVLTRVRMVDILRQLGREHVAEVDESLGREVARSAGARALVLATIRRFDELYAIELKALDPRTSEYLFTLKETGKGKASVPEMIDRLSEETRRRLRESPAEVSASRVDVASATTASFEAYAHFFRGEQAMDATRYQEALEAYRTALAADPEFALAHYRIAYLGEFTGLDPEARRAAIEAAVRSASRVPAKERLLIQAWKAHVDGDQEQAHRLYERAVQAYPQDKEVLYMAGDLRFHEGELEKALALFERALELDPVWEPALMHVMDALARLGRIDQLLARSRRWIEKAPGGASYRALAQAEIAAGRFGDAERDARRAFGLDGNIFSRITLGEALVLAERYGEAEALVRSVAERAEASPDRKKAAASLAAALAYQGRRREALAVIERLAAHAPPPNEPSLRVLHLLGEESLDAARGEAERLAASGSRWEGISTVLALAGNLDGAAARAREPHRDRDGQSTRRSRSGVAANTIVRSRSCVRCSPLRAAAAISGSPPRGSKRTSRSTPAATSRRSRRCAGCGSCPAGWCAAGCTPAATTSRRWRWSGSASARGPARASIISSPCCAARIPTCRCSRRRRRCGAGSRRPPARRARHIDKGGRAPGGSMHVA